MILITLACSGAMTGLIERYRERLPFADDDPVVSLGEGATPLVHAPGLSRKTGVEVWCKLEGLNPTGSFKDRGMTCAVSAAVREGPGRSCAPPPATPPPRPPPTPPAPGCAAR
jgi:threonine synthase